MRALVFAAGLGTRLKPITDTVPKALVPVCSKPLLGHLVEKLKQNGYGEVVINLHHFPQQIKDYVEQNGSFGIKVSFSDESDLLRETGGGIRHAAPLLDDGEPFLVHNVDIISNLDIEAFYEAHMAASISADTPLATLLVSDRETSRYFLFDAENNLVGWMNKLSGEVKSPYGELRRDASEGFDHEEFLKRHSLKKLAFAGVHIISPAVFGLMEKMPERFPIVDFYLQMADKYIIKGYVQPNLEMVDVGKLDSLEKAEELCRKFLEK